jgi:hypothetical protein
VRVRAEEAGKELTYSQPGVVDVEKATQVVLD